MTVRAIYGDGAGKTTSALGHVVRSLGNGSDNVLIVQFMKNDESIGEYKFFERLPDVECRMVQFGVG